jgi:hypothetical protein
MRLKVSVESDRQGFCTRGCHSSFYRSRCLVCEEPLRRKNERQRFGSGHAVCAAEYRRFPRVYDYPKGVHAYHPTSTSIEGGRSAHFTGLKTGDKCDQGWRQTAGPKLSERGLALATIDPPRLTVGPPSHRFMNLVAAARRWPIRDCRCGYCAARRCRAPGIDGPITDEELAAAARSGLYAPGDQFDITAFLDRRANVSNSKQREAA